MHSEVNNYKFDWVEYSVVIFMLLLSNLIGVYFSVYQKQKTFNDYMLGGKSMGIFPVSMSVVVSFVSGITMLGLSTEVYLYGTQFAMGSSVANITVFIMTGLFFVPVYYKLQLNSIFEYLELRFNNHVRIIGTLLFSLSLLVFLPAVIYVPALAFNQVTDLPVHVISPLICVSCLFYTAFGGLKAVLWTDALQSVFTLLALVFIVVLGTSRLGGLQEVWRINQEGDRLEFFNMDTDPFIRNSFFNTCLGCTFLYLTLQAVNPGTVQRFLSVPSLWHANVVLIISCIGFFIIFNLCNYMGLVAYARYHGCDPVASGVIKNFGQLVPLYVMELGRDYPGLAGLFMSGVLSAALSTISSWLNTLGGTLYKDVMEGCFPRVQHSDAKQSNIMKTIVFSLGVVCVLLVFVVEKLGSFIQMTISLLGIVYGSILSVFVLGIFFPRANTKGAISATVASLVISAWIIINAQYFIIEGKLKFPGKITSVDNCSASSNLTVERSLLFTHRGAGTPVVADDSVGLLYQLSYNLYIPLGTLIGVVSGLLVSYCTAPPDPSSLNPDLFTTYVHPFLPRTVPTRPHRDQYILKEQKNSDHKANLVDATVA